MNFGEYGVPRTIYELDRPNGYTNLTTETKVWMSKAALNGGLYTGISVGTADALIRAIQNSTFNSKLLWLAPLLGGNLGTMLAPLRDSLFSGPMLNPYPTMTAFVASDFDEGVGLRSLVGSGKMLSCGNMTAGSLTVAGATLGGMGAWISELYATGNTMVMGSASPDETSRYDIDLRTKTANTIFGFGLNTESIGLTAFALPGHYYGQRSAANAISFYRNGSTTPIATGAPTSTSLASATSFVMGIMGGGRAAPTPYECVAGCFYFTNGTFTAQEHQDMDTILMNYLIIPTSRYRPPTIRRSINDRLGHAWAGALDRPFNRNPILQRKYPL